LDFHGKHELTLNGHEKYVYCVKVLCDRNSSQIISGSLDTTMRMWNPQTGECVHVFKGHSHGVCCINILPDKRIVSGSFDLTLKIWDLHTGECTYTFEGHDSWILFIDVLSDGRIVSVDDDKTIKIWS